MSRGWIVTLAAAFGAGLAGGGVAVLAGSVTDRTTTVTVAAAPADAASQPAVTAAVARVSAGEFDAPAIYRRRRRASSPSAPSSAATTSTAPASSCRPTDTSLTNAHVVTDSPDHGTDSSDDVKAGRDFFVHFQDGNALPAQADRVRPVRRRRGAEDRSRPRSR